VRNNFFVRCLPTYYRVAIAGWSSRILLGLAQFVTIAMALNYLGVHLYAVFAIVIGLQGWFNLTDCGIGSSLQNYLSEFQARNIATNKLLTNATILLLGIFVVACILFYAVAPWLQFFLFHRIAPEFATSQHYILWISGIIFIATTLFGVAYRVLYAIHKGYWVYFYQCAGQVLSILLLFLLYHNGSGKNQLLMILLVWLLPQLLVAIVAYFRCFIQIKFVLHFDFQLIKQLLVRGIKFLGFGVAAALTLLADYFVMSQTLQADDIAIYNILSKGFNFIFFVYNALLFAIWPEIAELYVKKRWHEANAIVIKNMRLGMLFLLICTLLVLLLKKPIMLLLAPKLHLILPVVAIILFGFYFLLRVWADTYAMILQSQNHLKILWLIVPIQAVISLTGMWFFSAYFGLNGILFGLILSFLLTVVWVLPFEYYRRKKLYL